MKKAGSKKSSRHHVLLVSVFVIIIFLAVVAFVLQRNTYLEAVAGEAIRQTKQLAYTEVEAKVAMAIELGEKNFGESCPSTISPGAEQHWALQGDWKFKDLQVVAVECKDDMISCYYADSESEIDRADQVGIYNIIPRVKNCKEEMSGNILGCGCEISSGPPSGSPPGSTSPTSGPGQ